MSITGTASPPFGMIREWADSISARLPTFAAQVAVIHHGDLVVDLAIGDDADGETGVYSSSKGVAAMVIALLVQRGLLDLDAPVTRYWPEFAQAGKQDVCVRQLLSHQGGLPGVPGGFTDDELTNSERAAERLAAATPSWRPGAMFGYHGITIGVFMEELVRRLTGTTLQQLYDAELRESYGIDFFLGLPASADARYRPLRPPVEAPDPAELESLRLPDDSFNLGVFAPDADGVTAWDRAPLPNQPHIRRAGWAAAGGTGSARGLARAYAAAFGGVDGSPALISPVTREAMAQEQVFGTDRVLNRMMAFGVVYEKSHPGFDFGSHLALGHDGAGGALGYYDPLYGVAVGYIPQQIDVPTGNSPYAFQLSRLVRDALKG
jgi:CubicO group peptidase (beta-lactamase class C family)